jgi:hypothetical protein
MPTPASGPKKYQLTAFFFELSMIQSENGYFEGVNTLDESTGKVFAATKNEKRGKKGTLLFHLVVVPSSTTAVSVVVPKSHRKGGRITIKKKIFFSNISSFGHVIMLHFKGNIATFLHFFLHFKFYLIR